jgi:hypothetical protein
MDHIEDIFEKAGAPLHGDALGSVFDNLRGGRRGGVESVRLEHLRQAIELHEERRKLADLLSQADLPRLVARYVLPSPLFTDARTPSPLITEEATTNLPRSRTRTGSSKRITVTRLCSYNWA